MNKQRRKMLEDAQEKLLEIRGQIEAVKDEEQEAFDNMPEGLQSGEKGETISGNLDILQDIVDQLEEIDSNITGVIE